MMNTWLCNISTRLHRVKHVGEAFHPSLGHFGHAAFLQGGHTIVRHFDWALISALDQSAAPMRVCVSWVWAGGGGAAAHCGLISYYLTSQVAGGGPGGIKAAIMFVFPAVQAVWCAGPGCEAPPTRAITPPSPHITPVVHEVVHSTQRRNFI